MGPMGDVVELVPRGQYKVANDDLVEAMYDWLVEHCGLERWSYRISITMVANFHDQTFEGLLVKVESIAGSDVR